MRITIIAFILLLSATSAQAELRVVTTTTDLAALVRIIGGDHVDVEALCRGYQDPHYLEAKPSHMARLRKADLMVYVGLELEVGWLPMLVNGSRNPQLRAGNPGSLGAATGIEILDVPTGEVSRSEGDVHPLGNPHYWSDPHNQIVMAGTIAERLSRLDPEHTPDFESALASFQTRMDAAITDWKQRLEFMQGQQIVCYHQQWEYLLNWLEIDVMDYVENKPGIPPSPRHISQLREAMRRAEISVVLISNFFEPGHAKRVAEASSATLLILPTSIDGEDGLDDPFLYFEHVVSSLEATRPTGG
ncbi:zinc ABC transporter substrate-binding protein [bacterium]|nr:MAG: zinc ABC transporter substrate-binding protein [bacterium]RKZ14378.1 MAG: zinc ABC transporter substrate-binding protein [bacterium]